MNPDNKLTKFSRIAIIGKPNAGKSTLMNYLIKHKISIVTPKVQTTRSQILGLITMDDTQLSFIDTPGIFDAQSKFEKNMVRAAWSSIAGSDFVIFITDSSEEVCTQAQQILKYLGDHRVKLIVVLNKIDLSNDQKRLDMKDKIKSIVEPFIIFEISATEGKGCKELFKFLVDQAPSSPWLYDAEDLTTSPIRFLAAEITREKLFLKLHQELPYDLAVDTEQWKENEDGSVTVHQVIYVTRESQKKIILGRGGSMIKEVGTEARLDIEKSFDIKMHLYLFVKVKGNWKDDPNIKI